MLVNIIGMFSTYPYYMFKILFGEALLLLPRIETKDVLFSKCLLMFSKYL